MDETERAENVFPEVSPTSEPAGAVNSEPVSTPPAGSSDVDPGAQAPPSENNGENGEPGDGDKREKFIPRERFDEVLSKNKTLETQAQRAERYSDILDDLEREGWLDGKTAREALTERSRQQSTQQQSQAQFDQSARQIADGINQQIASGEITQEYGEAVWRAEYLALENARLTQQSQQTQTQAQHSQQQADARRYSERVETELSTLKTKYPEMDAAAVRDAHFAGRGDVAALAQASHTQNNARIQRAIADYSAQKQKDNARPAPEGSGGNAPPKPAIPDGSDPVAFQAYMDREARKTEQSRGY